MADSSPGPGPTSCTRRVTPPAPPRTPQDRQAPARRRLDRHNSPGRRTRRMAETSGSRPGDIRSSRGDRLGDQSSGSVFLTLRTILPGRLARQCTQGCPRAGSRAIYLHRSTPYIRVSIPSRHRNGNSARAPALPPNPCIRTGIRRTATQRARDEVSYLAAESRPEHAGNPARLRPGSIRCTGKRTCPMST